MKKLKLGFLTCTVAIIALLTSLIGATYAWFTDTESSDGNLIASGSFDVTAYWVEGTADPENATWNTLSTAPVFDYDRWEPGYVESKHIKVANEGNLAFTYRLDIIPSAQVSELADVIDVFYFENATKLNTRSDVNNGVSLGTLAEVLANEEALLSGVLLPANETAVSENEIVGSKAITIALKMREELGNEYQNMTLGSDFSIRVIANQYSFESDDFGNDYDNPDPSANATRVDSSIAMDDFLTMITSGEDIYSTDEINVVLPVSSGSSKITLTEDVNVFGGENGGLNFANTTVINGEGTMTVYSGALKTANELCVSGNATLIIKGGEHDLGAFSVTGNGTIIVEGGVLNCNATYAGIMGITFGENGTLIINDGIINLAQPINLNPNRCDNAYVEINGGIINMAVTCDNLFVVRDIMDKDYESGTLRGSKVRVNGGEFYTTYEIDSDRDANAFIRNGDTPDTNRVLVSNTYNGQPDYDCVVTGGSFYGSWQRADNERLGRGEFCEITFAGFVADGYEVTGNAVDGYVVSKIAE